MGPGDGAARRPLSPGRRRIDDAHRGMGRLWTTTNGLLLLSLLLAFEHREVVHEVLHPGASLGGQLLSRWVGHRGGGGAQLVGAPGQRSSLAQERRDRFRRGRNRTGHVGVGLSLILRSSR